MTRLIADVLDEERYTRDEPLCHECQQPLTYHRDLHKWAYLCDNKDCPEYENSRRTA